MSKESRWRWGVGVRRARTEGVAVGHAGTKGVAVGHGGFAREKERERVFRGKKVF